MSKEGNLLRSFFSYSAGRLIVLLAGLISLPLMTRLLSKEDYGLMSLVFLAITLTSSLSAMGFPQSTTRYFAEYSKLGQEKLQQFCSTMTYGAFVSGTIAALLLLLATLALSGTESFEGMAVHLRYAAILVIIRVVTGVFLQIFRGGQQTFAFNLLQIVNRYFTIGVTVLLILFVYHDVRAVFVGTIIVEAAILVLALIYLNRKKFISWVGPDSSYVGRAIKFGTPLILADVLVTVVASSDRFAIQYFLGPDSVATYSVAYDISNYVAIMFASPLQLAILPIVYSLWADEGEKATQAFLEKSVNLSVTLVIAIIAGFAIVGPDLVVALASEKYIESGMLVPYVALGVVLGSIHFLLFTGLLIHEKTAVITALNAGAAAANLALNLILIPRVGIIGAAYATIITYVALNVTTFYVSGRYLKVHIDSMLLLKAVVIAAVMSFIVSNLDDLTGYRVLDTFIQIIAGVLVFTGVLYASDKRIRGIVTDVFSRVGSSQ